MESIPGFIQPHSYDRLVHRLALAHASVQRTTDQLLLLQQRSLGRQQRIQDSQNRANQLQRQLEGLSNPVPAETDRVNNTDLTLDNKPTRQVDQLQQQLEQRRELLRQSTHDLQNNFGIVSSLAGLLDQAQTPRKRQQIMIVLQRNVQQAQHLLTQLLDMTRLEGGVEQRHLSRFDVADLLTELVKNMRPLARSKQLRLRKRGTRALLVEGDRLKLYRIAQNLLDNAIKYTRAGGVELAWQTGPGKQEWSLRVTDTGPGLRAEGVNSGEGIGLLIVRQLCTLLAGRLDVVEPTGGGTQFVLSFPRAYPS